MVQHVLLASAELDPFIKVGGLGEATTGLARALTLHGAKVEIVVPDYPICLDEYAESTLEIPDWAGSRARVRTARVDGVGAIHAVWLPGIDRCHPYIDPDSSQGWHDNDHRFYAFGAAVAALANQRQVDVLHLNDWHTAAAIAWFPPERTVLTIHNLAHQGDGDLGWLSVLGSRAPAFEHLGRCNPLAAAVRLSRRVVTVSPGYAREVLTPEHGCGLEGELAARGDRLVGIRNGLDPRLWNPAEDSYLPANFCLADLEGKQACRSELLRTVGQEEHANKPVIGMVSRFVDQKGIDLVLELAPFLDKIPAQLILHGTGDARLIEDAERAASTHDAVVRVVRGYSEAFAHLVVAGSDLMCVPSRFEPCGLTQMQAMGCGTIPVVTAVGGLADTVVDTDSHPGRGTGFVAGRADVPSLLDALHRAVRGWRNTWRRQAIQRRGMSIDWTWHEPSERYLQIYREVSR